MKYGYLASSFDMMNVRDLDLIAQAKALCSELVLGVFTDEFAEVHHGRRPVVPLNERVALLQYVRGIDRVLVHDNEPLSSVMGVDGDYIVFTISDEGVVFAPFDEGIAAAGDRVELTPGRMTSSRILRDALTPARASAVA